MPRYAKGSLEQHLWDDLQKEANEITPIHVGNPERRNSRASRAHRVDRLLQNTTPGERIREIKSVCHIHDKGWITDDSFLDVVTKIIND